MRRLIVALVAALAAGCTVTQNLGEDIDSGTSGRGTEGGGSAGSASGSDLSPGSNTGNSGAASGDMSGAAGGSTSSAGSGAAAGSVSGGGTGTGSGVGSGTIDASVDTVGDAAVDATLEGGPLDGGTGFCPSVCGPGTKLCDYQCVSTNDPAYGCSAIGCDACTSPPGATSLSCSAGACAIASCTSSFADCDGDYANGCEADLGDPQTCGSCRNACSTVQVCNSGACASSCAFPKTNCNGACHDLESDVDGCGSCGTSCISTSTSTTSCTNGSCTSSCINGCTSLTDSTNCGASHADCQHPPGITEYAPPYGSLPACIGGQCGFVCAVGFSTCSGTCVDENTDPSNCGGCGTICPAGVCVAAQCTSTAGIQFVTADAQDIAVDAINLYYLDTNSNVWQVSKSTRAPIELATAQASPHRIAVDSSSVYWTSNLGSAVLRAPIGGGAPFQVLYPATSPTGIAVDATNVYWSDTAGTHSAPKAGGGAVATLSATAVSDAFVQDATFLYGSPQPDQALAIYGGPVFSLDKSTGAYLAFDSSNYMGHYWVWGAATDDTDVYWYSASGPAGLQSYFLSRAPKTGGAATTYPLVWGGSAGSWLAAENCALYWTSGSSIFRMTTPAGSPPRALVVAPNAKKIVLDETDVYWVDSGFIGRVPK